VACGPSDMSVRGKGRWDTQPLRPTRTRTYNHGQIYSQAKPFRTCTYTMPMRAVKHGAAQTHRQTDRQTNRCANVHRHIPAKALSLPVSTTAPMVGSASKAASTVLISVIMSLLSAVHAQRGQAHACMGVGIDMGVGTHAQTSKQTNKQTQQAHT
jgi:hypothetical protein